MTEIHTPDSPDIINNYDWSMLVEYCTRRRGAKREKDGREDGREEKEEWKREGYGGRDRRKK